MTRHGDRGQVGGIEVLPFGLLIFVTGVLFIASAWGVVDARFATDAAAREGVRTVVERASAGATDAQIRSSGLVAARSVLTDHGRTGEPTIAIESDGYLRCTIVTVTVSYAMPAIRVPFLGPTGPPITVSSHHSQRVDPLRAGVGGEATCIS